MHKTRKTCFYDLAFCVRVDEEKKKKTWSERKNNKSREKNVKQQTTYCEPLALLLTHTLSQTDRTCQQI